MAPDPRSPEEVLIDAMAADLEANAGLPAHILITKRRPRALLPQDLPALVIWLDDDSPLRGSGSGQTTGRFPCQLTVGIAWHEQSVEEAVTLVNDEDLAASLLRARRAIKDRVLVWMRDEIPGMPTGAPYDDSSIDIGDSPFFQTPEEEGLTEGYALAVLITQTESPQ